MVPSTLVWTAKNAIRCSGGGFLDFRKSISCFHHPSRLHLAPSACVHTPPGRSTEKVERGIAYFNLKFKPCTPEMLASLKTRKMLQSMSFSRTVHTNKLWLWWHGIFKMEFPSLFPLSWNMTWYLVFAVKTGFEKIRCVSSSTDRVFVTWLGLSACPPSLDLLFVCRLDLTGPNQACWSRIPGHPRTTCVRSGRPSLTQSAESGGSPKKIYTGSLLVRKVRARIANPSSEFKSSSVSKSSDQKLLLRGAFPPFYSLCFIFQQPTDYLPSSKRFSRR